MYPNEPEQSTNQTHLSDWQRDAVLAAQQGVVLPSQPDASGSVEPVLQPGNNGTEQIAQPMVPPQPPIVSSTFAQQPVQVATPQFADPITSPAKKHHWFRSIIIIFVVVLAVFAVIAVGSKMLAKPKASHVAILAPPTVREIPTDCYQFNIPVTFEFDLSTTNCTLSGGNGKTNELVGVQPVKVDKTDDATLKNISQYTINSFAKNYPSLRQSEQASTQFAGKPALKTTAILTPMSQLTIYFVKPDKPYVIKDNSNPLVLVTYVGEVGPSSTLSAIEKSWNWK